MNCLMKNDQAIQVNTKRELINQGYTYIPSETLVFQLKEHSDRSKFILSYENLCLDQFMKDKGCYRKRRFGVFHYRPQLKEKLFFMGNDYFFQSEKINLLNGGVKRIFEGLENSIGTNNYLRAIILNDINLLPTKFSNKDLTINVHQIRIETNTSFTGKPTPEGIHQDGHNFVAQHLIKKEGVSGGKSTIYNLNNNPLFSTTLTNHMDTIIVNDPEVKHGVSSIKPYFLSGYRDMLLIDFNILELQ